MAEYAKRFQQSMGLNDDCKETIAEPCQAGLEQVESRCKLLRGSKFQDCHIVQPVEVRTADRLLRHANVCKTRMAQLSCGCFKVYFDKHCFYYAIWTF